MIINVFVDVVKLIHYRQVVIVVVESNTFACNLYLFVSSFRVSFNQTKYDG